MRCGWSDCRTTSPHSTQAAAIAALEHAPEMLAMVDDIKAQRDRLLVELPERGYPVHDSAANFVLFGGVPDPHAMFEALLAQGHPHPRCRHPEPPAGHGRHRGRDDGLPRRGGRLGRR